MNILITIARSRITARDRLARIRQNIGEAISDAVMGQPSQYELDLVVAEIASLRAALASVDDLLQRKGYAKELPWARETMDATLFASLSDAPPMSLKEVLDELYGGWNESRSDRLEDAMAREKK